MAKPLILIVEDDAELGPVLEEVLQSFGHRARRATTAEAALAALDEERPALALVDWSVLDDPAELAARFRSAEVPLLLATGMEGAGERARRLSARAVLQKPYTVEELMAAIERVLATRSAARRPGAGPPP